MEDTTTLREARATDADALGALWRAFLDEQSAFDERVAPAKDALDRWQNDFPVWLDDPAYQWVVAVRDGDLCGFVAAHRWAPPPIYRTVPEVYLTELYVRPSARRNGIARRLVHAVRDWATDGDAVRVRLQVLSANADAQDFWNTLGAEPLSETYTIACTPSPRENVTNPTDRNSFGFTWNKP